MEQPHKGRALVVEDMEELAELISLFLQQDGWQVAATGSASEALEVIDKEPPDVALIDVLLSEGRGDRIVRKLQQLPGRPAIILMSGLIANIPSELIGVADAVLQKPFTVTEMRQALEQALSRRAEREQ